MSKKFAIGLTLPWWLVWIGLSGLDGLLLGLAGIHMSTHPVLFITLVLLANAYAWFAVYGAQTLTEEKD